jgi:hypothetical protein
MAHVEPFWMVLEGKDGHMEFWSIFPPFYRKDLIAG